MHTRFSLNPEYDGREEARHWATFSDVALSMLLIFMLFILAQFLQYERIFVLEEIARRKSAVAERIQVEAGRTPGTSVEVLSEDDLHQRIRVTGSLVFQQCRDDLTDTGVQLLRNLGSALQTFDAYFEDIQVEGHADRQLPTGAVCLREGIEDNWQLSARRATEVVRLFAAEGFLSGTSLSSVGRGEFHSLSAVSDTSAAALERDRRIEIVLRYTDEGIFPDEGDG